MASTVSWRAILLNGAMRCRGSSSRPTCGHASVNALAKWAAQSGVRGACLTMTALPASTAGTIALTAVRSG